MSANGMREGDVRRQTLTEERGDAALRPIEELVGQQQVERRVLGLEAPNGARRENPFGAEQLEAEDVGAKVQFRREDAVPDAMPREKRHPLALQNAGHVRPGWVAEWRRHAHLLALLEVRH